MADKILLVQGDTRPPLTVSLTDQATGLPINISGSTPRLYIRALGDTAIKTTLQGTLLPGAVQADGSINSASPYNVAGYGGRCAFGWNTGDLDTAGDFEGEIEVTFGDGSKQTVYQTLKFKVRGQFA